MIPLNDAYFEDEIREGFYVPAEVKQAWGAEIEVLNEIDRVCKKHGLQYFAAWGTLLGIVRHGGIIPWDDDFDIFMLRKDYEKFMSVYKEDMPEGFDVITFKNNPDHIQFISNVVGKRRICFEQEHLEKFHGFPYISGIDIFLMDNMSIDEVEEKERMKIADLMLQIADSIFGGSIKGKDADDSIASIEKWCNVKVPRNLKGVELRIYLYTLVEKWISKVPDEKANEIGQIVPWGIKGTGYHFNKHNYDRAIEVPFESGTISTSAYYYEQVVKSYHEFMKIYKDVGGHNYPFFDKQKEDLQKVLDFDMPGYRFTDEVKKLITTKRNNESRKANSYRVKALGVADILADIYENIAVLIQTKNQVDDEILNQFADLQQVAIELGTYIENVKGEGYITVTRLESLCELAFNLCTSMDAEMLIQMKDIIANIRSDIQNRKEVVFMPFKSKYWDSFNTEYQRILQDSDNVDVYVVALPYYYKNYDGSLRDIQYDYKDYSAHLKVINYNDFDLAEHMPDAIYIQNPYDEFNASTSLPTQFYSSKLRDYTDELIYIPWFKTSEFDESDARAYKNMRYYAQMPGVVNADKVIVQSDNIRKLYINKLCEFAGEETRDIWERKIFALEIISDNTTSKEEITEGVNGDKKSSNKEPSNSSMLNLKTKKILFMNDFSAMLYNQEKCVEKIRNVMDVFEKSTQNSNLSITWAIQPNLEGTFKIANEKLYDKFIQLEKEYSNKDWCQIVTLPPRDELEDFIKDYNGFYGDGGVVAHYCRNAGIPVMIQNYDIN